MYPNMISSWKKILLEGVTDIFKKGQNSRKQTESRIDEGYLQSGQIKIEQKFLAKGISRSLACCKPQPPKSRILYCGKLIEGLHKIGVPRFFGKRKASALSFLVHQTPQVYEEKLDAPRRTASPRSRSPARPSYGHFSCIFAGSLIRP